MVGAVARRRLDRPEGQAHRRPTRRTRRSSCSDSNDLGAAWAGGAREADVAEAPVCPANQPNNSDLTVTGHAESRLPPDRRGLQVDTDVRVLKSAKQVGARASGSLLSPSLSDCLRYDLIKSVGGQGVTMSACRRFRSPKAGDHSALYRVTLSVKSGASRRFGSTATSSSSRTGAPSSSSTSSPRRAIEAELPSLENRIAKRLAAKATG